MQKLWLVALMATVSCAATDRAHDAAHSRLERDNFGIVLIDAQPAFWDGMHGDPEPVLERLEQLLLFADVTNCPLVATFEHSPESNGWLPQRLEECFPKEGQRYVKRTFDCCREPEIAAALNLLGVSQILIAGAETDVCVLQSTLGLLEMGFEVYLLEDCVFSNEANVGPALRRCEQAGAIPTTFKSVFYELEGSVDTATLPEQWRERYRELRERIKSPYALVPSKP